MSFIRGEQALAERQYEVKRQGLLLEREALMGDYDRMVDRAEIVLGLEQQQKQDAREDQRTAINFMMQTASGQEQLFLARFERQLGRQDEADQRIYEERIREQSDIRSIAASDPVAFAKYVAAEGYPKTFNEVAAGIGRYKEVEGVGTDISQAQSIMRAIQAGTPQDTALAGASSKVRSMVFDMLYAPRDWTDEEFRTAIRTMRTQDKAYQDALNEIGMDTTVQNKDRGRLIATEIYGEEVPGGVVSALEEIPEVITPPEEAPTAVEKRGVLEERGIIPYSEIVTPLFTE